MSSTTKRRLLRAGFLSALVTVSLARAEPAEAPSGVGVFDGHGDIGRVARHVEQQ